MIASYMMHYTRTVNSLIHRSHEYKQMEWFEMISVT